MNKMVIIIKSVNEQLTMDVEPADTNPEIVLNILRNFSDSISRKITKDEILAFLSSQKKIINPADINISDLLLKNQLSKKK